MGESYALCRACGALLRPEGGFCGNCGTKVEHELLPTPQVCPQCQGALQPGAQFCGNCGASIPVDEPAVEAAPAALPGHAPEEPLPEGVSEVLSPAREEPEPRAGPVTDEPLPESAPGLGAELTAPAVAAEPAPADETETVLPVVPILSPELAAAAEVALRDCPQCGAPLRPEALFCGICGADAAGVEVQAGAASEGPACSNCGAALKPEARFCPRCGAPTGEVQAVQEPAVVPLTCLKCGAALKPGARFCPRCGVQVEEGRPAPSAVETCVRCGAPLKPGATVCTKCWARVRG